MGWAISTGAWISRCTSARKGSETIARISTSLSWTWTSCSDKACFAFTWTLRANSGEMPYSFMYLLSFVNWEEVLLVRNERRVRLEVMLDTNHDAIRKPVNKETIAKDLSERVSGTGFSMLPAKFVKDQCNAMTYCSHRWSSCTPSLATQLSSLERPMPSHMQAAACASVRIAPMVVRILMSRITLSERAFSMAVSRSLATRSSLTRRATRISPISWVALFAESVNASIQSASTSNASGNNHVLAYLLAISFGCVSKLPSGRLTPVRKDMPMSNVQKILVIQVAEVATAFSGTSRNSSGATTASWIMKITLRRSQTSLLTEVGRMTGNLRRGASWSCSSKSDTN
mmetsp:Transcript_97902/g.272473  ORF Transcript_97902/g.272473 Transcript_97902/m.272473 type:complete len:344 (+) Transcript_97902:629-1660(+)